jgi:catalase
MATSKRPGRGSTKSSVSGPSKTRAKASSPTARQRSATGVTDATSAGERLAAKLSSTDALSREMPFNPVKSGEYGPRSARPEEGPSHQPSQSSVVGSTLTEVNASPKVGAGRPKPGENPANSSLDRVRTDSGGRALTTNQGVAVSDNQSSLKAGLRGPSLLEDFVLREKITHFDHERIPERVVHARGSAAHGYFECYEALTEVTNAAPLSEAGKRTPVFVRFSTVAGERGSTDLARDVRGFAVKFYTTEGIWDLVGNNIPVFFIQDAVKFPDLVHAVKPEPHHAMPQAASAHDTFWDFAGLMPEITHMLMWVMSDRAIPRSYRMMQGFGVHTFRLVNDRGESVFVKFHWNPALGTHSVMWDEAVKISGADPDFHRRDLWEAIEAGAYPEWELGLQIFTEREAEGFSFDVLDATKIVPEELVPVRAVGKMVLNRNPDNFFAETEQVAFCTQHVVPGIDFSNDPLLQGRNFSYLDTQISRLGGPNFHELPINSSLAQVHNNQRDAIHRQGIPRGRVAYEPNSLAGGCPFQAGMKGFVAFPQPIKDDKVRGKPERFADHYTQATLFWNSQTPIEQTHIVNAFRFELTKVQTPAVRERIVAGLLNVDKTLASRVASGLGIDLPAPLPRALPKPARPEVTVSPSLSLFARPGIGTIATRRVAVLVADGVEGDSAATVYQRLEEAGAVPLYLGQRLGSVKARAGKSIDVEATLEVEPGVLFDALVLPDGEEALNALSADGRALEFIQLQYRHCKPILALGASTTLLKAAGVPIPEGADDVALIGVPGKDSPQAARAFMEALAKHRNFARESDRSRV